MCLWDTDVCVHVHSTGQQKRWTSSLIQSPWKHVNYLQLPQTKHKHVAYAFVRTCFPVVSPSGGIFTTSVVNVGAFIFFHPSQSYIRSYRTCMCCTCLTWVVIDGFNKDDKRFLRVLCIINGVVSFESSHCDLSWLCNIKLKGWCSYSLSFYFISLKWDTWSVMLLRSLDVSSSAEAST